MGILKCLTVYNQIYEVQQDSLGVKKTTITFHLMPTGIHRTMFLLGQG